MTTDKDTEGMDELISDFNRFYILTILYKGPAHGYSIINQFKKEIKKEISPSLVYPFLQQLEEKGYVEHTAKMVGEKRRKNFELTEAGKELCTNLFKRFSELVSIAFEPSLDSCAHCNCKVYKGTHRETINNVETTFCCIHCAQAYKQNKKPPKT
ncbi:PadR family transcriptional regulator [Candidatus Bathycorpusculum sp.]|uniref:PadR family transcriptional regulator n=1 Tax=Candidatus Bathycorpusculum sp. TaxID=2994959 RepID=UPI00282880E7|nr:PadR family transcriptional regulator [Candidatus Termitimicrobium sp.]MCL2431115.1 PadR family transcriptional regulator [Candidatus Termitimicrobium sp.]